MSQSTEFFFEQDSPRRDTTPAKKYREFDEWCMLHRIEPHTIWYLSSTITSGGYRMLVGPDQTLSIGEIALKNRAMGKLFQSLLEKHREIPSQATTVAAVDIGSCFDTRGDNWTEAEYLLFWFLVMSGVDSVQAELFQNILGPRYFRHPVLNNHAQDKEARRPCYEAYVADFLGVARSLQLPLHKVHSVIRIFDADSSLGSYAEHLLAHHLDIPLLKTHLQDLGSPEFDLIREELLILLRAGVSLPTLLELASSEAKPLVLRPETAPVPTLSVPKLTEIFRRPL